MKVVAAIMMKCERNQFHCRSSDFRRTVLSIVIHVNARECGSPQVAVLHAASPTSSEFNVAPGWHGSHIIALGVVKGLGLSLKSRVLLGGVRVGVNGNAAINPLVKV